MPVPTVVYDQQPSAFERRPQVAVVRLDQQVVAPELVPPDLVDEIQINIAPVLLGDGLRLFEHLDTESIELESTGVIEYAGLTDLPYRVALVHKSKSRRNPFDRMKSYATL